MLYINVGDFSSHKYCLDHKSSWFFKEAQCFPQAFPEYWVRYRSSSSSLLPNEHPWNKKGHKRMVMMWYTYFSCLLKNPQIHQTTVIICMYNVPFSRYVFIPEGAFAHHSLPSSQYGAPETVSAIICFSIIVSFVLDSFKICFSIIASFVLDSFKICFSIIAFFFILFQTVLKDMKTSWKRQIPRAL